jgi:MFS family permease
MLAFAVLDGLGHGTLNLTTNVSISNLFPQKRASALNLINLFYGIGAFIAPAVAGLALRIWNSSLPALWLGAGIELLLLPMFLGYFHIPAAAPQKMHRRQPPIVVDPCAVAVQFFPADLCGR